MKYILTLILVFVGQSALAGYGKISVQSGTQFTARPAKQIEASNLSQTKAFNNSSRAGASNAGASSNGYQKISNTQAIVKKPSPDPVKAFPVRQQVSISQSGSSANVSRTQLDSSYNRALGLKPKTSKPKNVAEVPVPKTAVALSPQKQAGHVRGTPQHVNRVKQGTPTSTFFGEKSGERATQIAYQRGSTLPGRVNVKEYNFGHSVGTNSKGGMQTKVRVHIDSKGAIHGHPSGSKVP